MNFETNTKRAFTIIELVVALGVMAVVFVFSSFIFKACVDSQRTAIANAEILQKLRAITSQLDADFKGLNKNGEIFVAWHAKPISEPTTAGIDLDNYYERYDRIMFFSNGDFQSYNTNPFVRGNAAMICYMMGKSVTGSTAGRPENKRVLTRTQHILTADENLDDFFDPAGFNDSQWIQWRNGYEYDKMSIQQWKILPLGDKINVLSVVTDANIIAEDNNNNTISSSVNPNSRGAIIDPEDVNSIHMILCEGVGEFMIQGWSENLQKWLPQVDVDDDGDDSDTNFYFGSNLDPCVIYPYPPYGQVRLNNIDYPAGQVTKANFDSIPGLGKALKFTFTIYDSRGIIKEGMTFTHIVNLDI